MKSVLLFKLLMLIWSRPVWGAWIEICKRNR